MTLIFSDLSAALAHERIQDLLNSAEESREGRRLPRRRHRHRTPRRHDRT